MEGHQSYRQSFQAVEQAEAYDLGQYGTGTYSSLLWDVERKLLDRILDDMHEADRRSYLDFACGTGRVIGHIGNRFSHSVGIDISPGMLSRAQQRVQNSQFCCVDIRAQPAIVDQPFDLITAFRFLLNADHEDRIVALSWLREHLRTPNGRLLINNHGNLWSHKLISHPLRQIGARRSGRCLSGNVLSDKDALALFSASGLEVEAKYGCGIFGGKALRVIPYGLMSAVEHRAADSFLQRVAVNQIYVLRAKVNTS